MIVWKLLLGAIELKNYVGWTCAELVELFTPLHDNESDRAPRVGEKSASTVGVHAIGARILSVCNRAATDSARW